MGYFKKRRAIAEQKRLAKLLGLFSAHATAINQSVNQGVTDAINIFDAGKYEYENNFRWNLSNVIEGDGDKAEEIVREVANVINDKMEIYSLRISKKNREALARDILSALADPEKVK